VTSPEFSSKGSTEKFMTSVESGALTSRDVARRCVADLLAPVGWDEFLAKYWDCAPLCLQSQVSFSSLADIREVFRLIESGAPWQFRRLPEVYLDGGFVSHEDIVCEYVDMDGRRARAPNLARLRNLLNAGATVNCFGQEYHFPPLQRLREAFAIAFTAEVEVSFFYSRCNHQGLAPHYDCVEIFVLQIHGSKTWHISSQRVAAPLVGHGSGTVYDPELPHATMELRSGDLLYIPRGTFHQAIATSEESLHTAIAVKVPTYVDMLNVLEKTAREFDSVRSYLPLSDGDRRVEAAPRLLEMLTEVVGTEAYRAALEQLVLLRARAGSLSSFK
jgi:ribosomal protein L16 Arg81 hydroxylase